MIATPAGDGFAKRFGQVLEVLAPEPPDPDLEGYSQAELNTFKAFGRKPPPRRKKE